MPDAVTVAAAVPSPCTGVCRIDARSGCCEGCLRTLDEIAAWSTMDDALKRALWDALAARGARAQANAEPNR